MAGPRILTAEPQLLVTDMGAALAFYATLGFEAAFVHGEPPFYAQVRRGGARLNLRLVAGPLPTGGAHEREPDLLAATLAVDRTAPLAEEFAGRGVAFVQPPRTERWGARTFTVRDPAGNLLLFAGDA